MACLTKMVHAQSRCSTRPCRRQFTPTARGRGAPNCITLSRLILALVLFALIRYEGYWLTAAILFVVAAATDALDGYLARKYGQVTTLGRILDPFVDKFIICGAFLFLLEKTADPNHQSGVNAWMVVVVIGREMFVSSLRGFLEQQGLDFSADWAGKSKMILQCMVVTGCLVSLSPAWQSPGILLTRDILLWTAVLVTAWSGISYVFRAARLLQTDAPTA